MPRGAPILDLLGECLIRISPDGRITGWGEGAENLLGYAADDAAGRPFVERLGDEARIPAPETLKAGPITTDQTWRTRSGRRIEVEARWVLTEGGAERACLARDITARKRVEAQLRISDDHYRSLFHAMAASFWELDFTAVGVMLRDIKARGVRDLPAYLRHHPDEVRAMMRATRVMDANGLTLSLFGAEDPKGRTDQNVEPFWPEESTQVYADAVMASLSGAPLFTTETVLQNINGQRFDAVFTACFPPDAIARGVLLIGIVDISERVRAQAALARAEAELAHAARVSMLGELTASIAHEVNQPLAAIATNAETALRWLSRDTPEIGEAAALSRNIAADARRAADIIQRVRAMAGKHTPRREPLVVGDVMAEVAAFLAHELRSHRVTIALLAAPDTPGVCADRTQMQQVLVNLVMNAIQAMNAHQTTSRHIRMTASATPTGEAVISVEDSGPGLPDTLIDLVFTPFFSTRTDGMGLGLPISRSIIEAHGGVIDAGQAPGGGASFRFTLPGLAET